LIATFILINVVVAIVINHFEEEFEEGGSATGHFALEVTSGDVQAFGRVWAQYARDLGETLPVGVLGNVLNRAPAPLGLQGRELYGAAMLRFIARLNIPANTDSVHFVDVTYRLCQRIFGMAHACDWSNVDQLPVDHDKMVCLKAQALRTYPQLRGEGVWRNPAVLIYRVMTVQRQWRGYISRKQTFYGAALAVHERGRLSGLRQRLKQSMRRSHEIQHVRRSLKEGKPIAVSSDVKDAAMAATVAAATAGDNDHVRIHFYGDDGGADRSPSLPPSAAPPPLAKLVEQLSLSSLAPHPAPPQRTSFGISIERGEHKDSTIIVPPPAPEPAPLLPPASAGSQPADSSSSDPSILSMPMTPTTEAVPPTVPLPPPTSAGGALSSLTPIVESDAPPSPDPIIGVGNLSVDNNDKPQM
jgi:hypothetical protein